ncbi:phage gp6-like head-tail connector protein [Cronobacter sakazakii]|uniref:head-tail connector protein n=1 Tax=Cronobacter muytjensii TaxID=413501 RepID=UPI0029384499|nr:phage gp6-like head-tail connector protein [Cronobacter muytjensii]ELQ6112094.1 phage gp6-like head-tail connector protein [Cronobacter sakazakii]
MILSLSEIKAQLRIEEDFTEEDALLTLLGGAAEARTSNYLNRRLYATEVPDTDEDGLVVSNDIRQAMLMLCSHLYENRSSTSDVEMTEMPQSFKWLVDAYRFIPL